MTKPVVRRGPGTRLLDKKTRKQIDGFVFWNVRCPACGIVGFVWNNGFTDYLCRIVGCGRRRSPIVESEPPNPEEPNVTM